ncbi:MAG: TlpA family protein disulfide reductase [Algoriphagus aquaeductus]|uniref:TlpA family protein disulfide reductase n=1 Tax=Algoriphagus aquaeductus TaxID=475299 RepID=UPI0038798607
MKNFLLTCFLALLCLFGSTFSAQSKVAESPGVGLLHRFAGPTVSLHSGDTHRGGDARPDTFPPELSLVDQHLDPGAGEEALSLHPAPVTVSAIHNKRDANRKESESQSLASCVLCRTSNNIFLQSSLHLEIDGGPVPGDRAVPMASNQSPNPPANDKNQLPVETNPVLIYGELINPDSLGPLKVELIRHYTDRKSTFEKDDFPIETWPGEFFDGVVDPRAQKFSLSIPDLTQPAYLSLTIQNRPLLDRYLIFPGDSLKIGINLAQSTLVFGGPAAAQMEAQFQLRRIKLQNEFDQPRKIVVSNADDLLDQEDNRERWEANQVKFSSKLEFEKYGPEGLDKILGSLQNQDTLLCQIDEWLDLFGKNLSEQKKDLIRLDAFSGQLLGPVSMINRFYYHELRGQLQGEAWTEKLDLILNALLVFKEGAFDPESRKISASYLDFQMERLALISLIKGISFHDAVEQTYQGELADKLKASFLIQNLKRYPDPKALIGLYSKTVQSAFWRNRIQQLSASTIPGGTLISLELEDTLGNRILTSSLPAKPTLIYFYFSTCVHSAYYFQDLLWPLYKVMAKEMGVSLIAISVDKDRNLWLKRLPEYSNLEIPNYRLTESNKQKLVDYYEFSGYPRTFFIDADRRILSFGLDRTDSAKFTRSFLTILSAINPSNSNPNIPTL